MRMIIVSGLSGSGKTIALQTLEDAGFYCVDNLPLQLLEPFANTVLTHGIERRQMTAVGIDARNFLDQLADFPDIIGKLQAQGLDIDILFLQASDEALLRRYNETRRKHPLASQGLPLLEAIRRERRLLNEITAHATLIIDTSHTNLHELRERVRTLVQANASGHLTLLFESFGFKNGIPADADFVFDVRFLPNPHWDRKLRLLTGLDKPVRDFLEEQPRTGRVLDELHSFLEAWVPRFDTGSRSYLTVAIGCTGGQHRSVYITTRLAERFGRSRSNVMVRHRELN